MSLYLFDKFEILTNLQKKIVSLTSQINQVHLKNIQKNSFWH